MYKKFETKKRKLEVLAAGPRKVSKVFPKFKKTRGFAFILTNPIDSVLTYFNIRTPIGAISIWHLNKNKERKFMEDLIAERDSGNIWRPFEKLDEEEYKAEIKRVSNEQA